MGKISDILAGDADSDTEIKPGLQLKTENEYAKNYDTWRKKEQLNTLKTKYGEDALEASESSSSSDDDEDALELTDEVEKDFFKTLSYLKKKDPKIYLQNVSFFKEKDTSVKKEKKSKEQPMYLKDYERKLLLEKGGVISDEEDEGSSSSMPYTKELERIKSEVIKLGSNIEDNEDDKLGGFLELRKKTKEEEEQNEAQYIKFLQGQTEELEDDEMKSELKPLKEFWNDPNLDSGEKFLRDYVLKKRYLEKGEVDHIPSYDEIIHDSDSSLSGDEAEIEKQEEFEHKYNFRFEEPDQEFIKRYPRTIEQSLRKTDDRRKVKRQETKERKKKEKEEKMAEIKKLQELKEKEIEEKIEKLKEVTGATDIAFQDEDIDGDFDPEAYDKRMQALFNDDFYQGPECDQKPEFPDLDKELEIENWDQWNGDVTNEAGSEEYEPHCEDVNFNMDADFDPSTSLKNELIENSRGKKKRRRKSKVAEALSKPKPKFDPSDKNYEKYFDEYYKLDCEDIIGDLPCRFKYRDVIPNDFGLSAEEILLAKDKELNRWCSLKKTVQRRPEHVEKYDQIAYRKKANNVNLKKKLLPSLFTEEPEQPQTIQVSSVSNNKINFETGEDNDSNNLTKEELPENPKGEKQESKKRKKNKNKKKKQANNVGNEPADKTKSREDVATNSNENIMENKTTTSSKGDGKIKKNNKRKRVDSDNGKPSKKKLKKNKDPADIGISDARLAAFGINPKKFKNKLKYGNKKKS